MKQKLLLLEDVEGLGKSGDLASARPGFIRNFLLPQKKAVLADKNTLKMQTRLQELRKAKAVTDEQESKNLASLLKDLVFEFFVKVDPEGNMYGSISSSDIIQEAEKKEIILHRKFFPAHLAIKSLGRNIIPLKLLEGVKGSVIIEVFSEVSSSL